MSQFRFLPLSFCTGIKLLFNLTLQAATRYDHFDREKKYRLVQSRVFAWVSQRLTACIARHRMRVALRRWHTLVSSEVQAEKLQRRHTFLFTIMLLLRVQFLSLAWRRWRLAAAWVRDQQAGKHFKQRSKQAAATTIRGIVHALLNRRLTESWYTWRFFTMQTSHHQLLMLKQREKMFAFLHRVASRLRTNWLQTAWQTWTDICTFAAHQNDWDALARKAQMYALATLERAQVSMHRESLQRSWLLWRQRTQVAQNIELREANSISSMVRLLEFSSRRSLYVSWYRWKLLDIQRDSDAYSIEQQHHHAVNMIRRVGHRLQRDRLWTAWREWRVFSLQTAADTNAKQNQRYHAAITMQRVDFRLQHRRLWNAWRAWHLFSYKAASHANRIQRQRHAMNTMRRVGNRLQRRRVSMAWRVWNMFSFQSATHTNAKQQQRHHAITLLKRVELHLQKRRVWIAWRAWNMFSTNAASHINAKQQQRYHAVDMMRRMGYRLQRRRIWMAWRAWKLFSLKVTSHTNEKQQQRHHAFNTMRRVGYRLQHRQLWTAWRAWNLHTYNSASHTNTILQQRHHAVNMMRRVGNGLQRRRVWMAWRSWNLFSFKTASHENEIQQQRRYGVGLMRRVGNGLQQRRVWKAWRTWMVASCVARHDAKMGEIVKYTRGAAASWLARKSAAMDNARLRRRFQLWRSRMNVKRKSEERKVSFWIFFLVFRPEIVPCFPSCNSTRVVLFKVLTYQQQRQQRVMLVWRLMTGALCRTVSSAWLRWRLHVFASAASAYLTQSRQQQRLHAMLRILDQFQQNRLRAAWQSWTSTHQTAMLMKIACTRWLARIVASTARQASIRQLRRAFVSWKKYASACTIAKSDKVRLPLDLTLFRRWCGCKLRSNFCDVPINLCDCLATMKIYSYLPQDADAERSRTEKRRAALFIHKFVSSTQWRSLLVSWHAWQLYVVREESGYHIERHRRSRILIGVHHVINGFILRRMQAAWRVWTRVCVAAAHSEAVDVFTRKARSSAVKFLEHICVSRTSQKLQRAWAIWQEGMRIAEKKKLEQVCMTNLRTFGPKESHLRMLALVRPHCHSDQFSIP